MKRPPKRDSENLAEYRYCCDEERVQQQELEAHWGGETKEFIRNKAVEHFVLPEVQVIPEPDRIEEVKKPSLVSEVDYLKNYKKDKRDNKIGRFKLKVFLFSLLSIIPFIPFAFTKDPEIIGIAISCILQIGLIVGFVGSRIYRKRAYKEYRTKYDAELAAYTENQRQLHENTEKYAEKYKETVVPVLISAMVSACTAALADRKVLIQPLETELAEQIHRFEEGIQTTKDTLAKLYGTKVIFSKYQSIVPCMMFIEYLISSRCDALEGANGCYNLYESEIRANLIVSRLTDISSKMDTVIDKQMTICKMIQDTNEHLKKLDNQLIEVNNTLLQSVELQQKSVQLAAVTAVHTQAIAANTEAIKYISLVNG